MWVSGTLKRTMALRELVFEVIRLTNRRLGRIGEICERLETSLSNAQAF